MQRRRSSALSAFRHAVLALAFTLLFAVVWSGLLRAQEQPAQENAPGEPPRRSAAELMDVLMWNREPVGGPFALTDHTGATRRDGDFRGRFLLVYFGFTYCPDVCPADLVEIGKALDRLGEEGADVQPLFITLDPQRDTPSHLAGYVPLFHPRLIGLTGADAAIREVADAYKVYYRKVETGGGDYTVDHTAYVYLLDREGRYLGFFPPNTQAERMLTIIRPHLKAAEAPAPKGD